MLRILCTVSLLVAMAYGQLIVPQIPDIFPATCTAEDQIELSTCAMEMQNQTMESQEVLQLFGQAVMSGNITDAESMVMLDAVCSLLTDTVNCIRPLKDRCLTKPVMVYSFQQYEAMIQLCDVPHREKYFTQLVTCNKKLDIFNTVINDPQLINQVNELVNMTTGLGANITSIMDMSPEFFLHFQCRMVRRIGELTPLSKVNATCGQEIHDTYAKLYPKLLEMYQCDGGHIGIDANTTRTPVVANSTVVIDTNTTITINTNSTSVPSLNGTSTMPPAVNGTSTVAPNTNSTNTPVPPLRTTTIQIGNNTEINGNHTDNSNGNNTGSYVQPGSGSVVYTLCAILFAIVTVHMRN